MKNPVPIGVGYLAQYIVKPLLGFTIAKVPFHPGIDRKIQPSATNTAPSAYHAPTQHVPVQHTGC